MPVAAALMVTVVVPAAFVVMFPLSSTVATSVLLLVQLSVPCAPEMVIFPLFG